MLLISFPSPTALLRCPQAQIWMDCTIKRTVIPERFPCQENLCFSLGWKMFCKFPTWTIIIQFNLHKAHSQFKLLRFDCLIKNKNKTRSSSSDISINFINTNGFKVVINSIIPLIGRFIVCSFENYLILSILTSLSSQGDSLSHLLTAEVCFPTTPTVPSLPHLELL